MFIFPADERRTERLAEVRQWLATNNDDPLWQSDEDDADVRVLVLVHRMAAIRLGFPELYAALNDNAPSKLKDGLLDGTAWVLRPFISYLLPLVIASKSGADFDVITRLRKYCPLLSKERLTGQNTSDILGRLRQDVLQLVEMFDDNSTSTIREILTLVQERELAILDENFTDYLLDLSDGDGEEEDSAERASVSRFLNCRTVELWGYRKYLEEQSPFATQQGIKGAEFQRVLVVIDDEESGYNLFSYGKYFGISSLSDTDKNNLNERKDSVVDRTRRLFYVCCSRAVQDLAVVLFVPEVSSALSEISSKHIFGVQDIIVLDAKSGATNANTDLSPVAN